MKRVLALAIFLSFVSSCCFAQLTPEQKLSDFMALAALYDKNYGPYEWKIKAFGYDLLKLAPWLAEVNASTDDLAFYDTCVRYVASLNDFHDEYTLPSSYEVFLPFTVDIFEGKVLVDSIDTIELNPVAFPIEVGDELVSVDGTSAADWIKALGPYAVNGQGNPVSRNRLAAALTLDRLQEWYPFANNVKDGDSATVQIKSKGKVSTYTMHWQGIGSALNSEGPVPNPSTTSAVTGSRFAERQVQHSLRERAKAARNAWGAWTAARPYREMQSASKSPIQKLHDFSYRRPGHVIAGGLEPFGSPLPIFDPPEMFQLRLGGDPADEFVSGTFPAGKSTIGFIRIPSFDPTDQTNAVKQFQAEMTFFDQNTDGLVIDLMANGGGDACYTNTLLQSLFRKSFHTLGFQLRATEFWRLLFEDSLINAQFSGDQSAVKLYTAYLAQIDKALARSRGLTGQLPICSDSFTAVPAKDDKGKISGYSKPIVVLTDNFSASAAEIFSATLQDAARAAIYGVRTSGGGGNVEEYRFNATSYSEGSARVTLSLVQRSKSITTAGLPSAPLIENIGVNPDVLADYQTKDNLLHNGQTFVKGFTTVISHLIATGKP